MDLADMDLNLLVVFHHLLRERRVSRVAHTLGLSQPAVVGNNFLSALSGIGPCCSENAWQPFFVDAPPRPNRD